MATTLPLQGETHARPTTLPPRQAALLSASRVEQKGNIIVKWLTSTDHKTIGYMYLIASVLFFLLGGVMALIIRAELFEPGMQIIPTKEQYNQLFTMHGTIMLLMFATPLFAGFANAILPLQIGAPDVAFPRLNALALWLFIFGSLIAVAGFLTPQGAASFGWFAYQPLANATFSPGVGGNLWMLGLGMSGFGTIMGGVNFITTIITMRAPGMTMWRMPIFTWNVLITSILVLMAFPVLAAAILAAAADRVLGAHVYDVENGGVLLWQHLFWFFGHPEVYIIALPFFGIVSEVFPVFSRKPIFGYKTLVYATVTIAALSVAVWAHHMYVTGAVLLPSRLGDDAPTAVLDGRRSSTGSARCGAARSRSRRPWRSHSLPCRSFPAASLASSSPCRRLDFHVSDSYFVVAHFHYVVFGTVVFAMFSGFYFWWPKWTGRMLNERLGMVHFWMLFIGFHMTFLIQHWIGVDGMVRRYADYSAADGWTWQNQVSTIGAIILGASMIPFFLNVWVTSRTAPKVTVNDPWGYGGSLEWATSCPPPRHNFTSIPRIRSERPAFDLNHPEATIPIGVGPAKDAPDAAVYDVAEGEVK